MLMQNRAGTLLYNNAKQLAPQSVNTNKDSGKPLSFAASKVIVKRPAMKVVLPQLVKINSKNHQNSAGKIWPSQTIGAFRTRNVSPDS